LKLPAKPLTPPCKPMDCLPFSFNFRLIVYGAFFTVALDLGSLVGLNLVEVVQAD